MGRSDCLTKGGLFINTMTGLKSTNAKRRTIYNIDAIKSAADAITVAEAIGMNIQNSLLVFE